MTKMNIRSGDKVRVLAGKDKGKEAAVRRVHPQTGRVTVEKVNMVKKAMRPTQQNPQGGIMSVEAPIHASNVALVCPACKKTTRIAVRREGGKKIRYCRKCDKAID